jgi:hypothetical protein
MKKQMVELFRRDAQGLIVPCGRMEIHMAIDAGYTQSEGDMYGISED